MKKGQTEILGFAMVVLLITVGMLFVIGFIVLSEPSNIRQVYVDKQLAVNLNDAIISSTSSCKNIEFERLIVDCAGAKEIRCGGSMNSCDFIQDNLENVIFLETLDKWYMEYRYKIYTKTNPKLVQIPRDNTDYENKCKSDIEPGIFYLPSTRGTVFVRLDICS